MPKENIALAELVELENDLLGIPPIEDVSRLRYQNGGGFIDKTLGQLC